METSSKTPTLEQSLFDVIKRKIQILREYSAQIETDSDFFEFLSNMIESTELWAIINQSSEERAVRDATLIICNHILFRLNNEITFYKMHKISRSEPNFRKLQLVVKKIWQDLNLEFNPTCFFSEDYYCVMPYGLYSEIGVPSPNRFISIDNTDPVLFWPLVVHEIAHFKILQDVDNELIQILSDFRLPETLIDKAEESISDLIGIQYFGEAYFYASLLKLWNFRDTPANPSHPSENFRFYLMKECLRENGIEPSLNLGEWAPFSSPESESLFQITTQLIDFAKTLFKSPVECPLSLSTAAKHFDSDNIDLRIPFLLGWKSFLIDGITLPKVDAEIFSKLERWGREQNPATQR